MRLFKKIVLLICAVLPIYGISFSAEASLNSGRDLTESEANKISLGEGPSSGI